MIQRKIFLALTTALVTVRAFENEQKAGWKLDDDGHIVMQDGNPVWVNADGAEGTIAVDTISRLNAEAKSHRTAKEKAEAALRAYEGIDPAAARSALETVEKLDQNQLVEAGRVDEVKRQLEENYKTEIEQRDQRLADVSSRLSNTLLSAAFASSQFIKDKVAIPPDLLMASFGKSFKVTDDGKVVATDANGNPLYSKTRIGEEATFDEALAQIIEQYPHKDSILKAPASGGGSGNGGAGGQQGQNAKFIKRDDFDKLPASEQATLSASMREGKVQLVD